MNDANLRQEIQLPLHRIWPIVRRFGPKIILHCIYSGLVRQDVRSDHPEPVKAALREIATCLSDLAKVAPQGGRECMDVAKELGLSDIEQVFLGASALRRMPHETVWQHYFLAASLNRLTINGIVEARYPCILHCLLALRYRDGDHFHEPLPLSILARELEQIAPREAIQTGIEALQLGYSNAYSSLMSAANSLGVFEGPIPANPNIKDVKMIAAKCDLPALKNVDVVQPEEAIGTSVKVVIDGEARTLPVPMGDNSYYLFRSAGEKTELPPISVYEIRNGIISLDIKWRLSEFYVFDEGGHCISDLSWGINPFLTDDITHVDGALGILGDQFSGSMNICHFLLDNLSRIAIYQKYADEKATYLMDGNYKYYLDMAALAGLKDQIFCPAKSRISIRADRLLIASNIIRDFRHPAHLCADWALNFLRMRLGAKLSGKGDRKIYISRADVSSRHVNNAAEVESILARRGYEIITLSDLAAKSQIELFCAASHVVSVHGAGLTNLLFSAPGTQVLEILPPMVASPAYWMLCSQIGHNYRTLIADDPEYPKPDYSQWGYHPEYNDRNIVVPVDRLIQQLDDMDGQP